jgi:hypothetical protein
MDAMQKAAELDPLKIPVDQRYRDAMTRLLKYSLMGAGTGVAARGLLGFRDLFSNKKLRRPTAQESLLPAQIRLGEKDEDLNRDIRQLAKAAEDMADAATEKYAGDSYLEQAGAAIADNLPDAVKWDVSNPLYQSPVGLPLLGLGTGVGAYGGWKLTDYIMNKRDERLRTSKLRKAKKDYERALRQQFARPEKMAAAEATLDTVAEGYEKDAGFLDNAQEYWNLAKANIPTADDLRARAQQAKEVGGGASGAYLLSLLGTAGVTGKMMYDWTKSRDKSKAIQRALTEERRRRQRRRPDAFQARSY